VAVLVGDRRQGVEIALILVGDQGAVGVGHQRGKILAVQGKGRGPPQRVGHRGHEAVVVGPVRPAAIFTCGRPRLANNLS
jgi:hypothetical protein